MEHTGFPSDETLASFLDGKLDPETRRRVIEHMTTCDECYATVMGGGDARIERSQVRESVALFSLKSFALSSVAAAILLVVITLLISHSKSQDRSGTIASSPWTGLQDVAPSNRHEEGRIFGFRYREHAVKRGSPTGTGRDAQYYRLLALAGRIDDDVSKHPDVVTLHADGVAQLLLVDSKSAVVTLEKALSLATGERDPAKAIQRSNDVALLIDVAVAYHERGARPDGEQDRVLSLDASDRAVRLASHSPEALWNRAVAIEALGMTLDAAKAWEAYLAVDASSPWADEARQKLSTLRESEQKEPAGPEAAFSVYTQPQTLRDLTRRYPFEARVSVEETLLSEIDTDQSPDVSAVERSRTIGATLQNNGEFLVSDAVACLDALDTRNISFSVLIAAHQYYAEGRRALRADQVASAYDNFTRAAEGFQQAGSPFIWLARLGQVSCVFLRNDYSSARRQMDGLSKEILVVSNRYPSVHARALWLKGTIADQTGDKTTAYESFAAAAVIFARLHEEPNVAQMEGMLASQLNQAGESDSAVTHYVIALALLGKAPVVTRFQVHFESIYAGLDTWHLGWAATVLDAIRRNSLSPADTATACMLGALIEGKRGVRSSAARYADLASAAAARIEDADVRVRVNANITLTRIALCHDAGLAPEESTVNDALAFFQRAGSRFVMGELLTEQGRLCLARNDRAAAMRAYEAAVAELERSDPSIGSVPFGSALMSERASPFEELVGMLLDHGDQERALAHVERQAALTVSPLYFRDHDAEDVFHQSALAPFDGWRTATRAGVYIVRFYCMKGELVEWLIDQSAVRTFRIAIDREALASMVREFTEIAKTADLDRVRSAGRDLSAILVNRWIQAVPAGSIVVLTVPDSMSALPFAALTAGDDRTFLIERNAISTSSSLAVYAANMTRDQSRTAQGVGFFAVYHTAPVLELDELPAVTAEVRSSARSYRGAVTVENATRAEFLSGVRHMAVVHFAGHATVNAEMPLDSCLVFGDADVDEARLRLSEFRKDSLSGVRLLVLSACDTARTERPGLSISNILSMQGVPSVISASWAVRDADASSLMKELHRQLSRNMSRAEALRLAQISCLHSNIGSLQRPRTWAAFSLVGVPGALNMKT